VTAALGLIAAARSSAAAAAAAASEHYEGDRTSRATTKTPRPLRLFFSKLVGHG
jgi:hypothetical protein